jgi:predicted dehydrogenase
MNMGKKIGWGILGCGKIARKFASDLKLVEDAQLIAVASLNQERGNEFAETFHATRVHTQYDLLAKDPQVDAIYIATPHGFHYEHTMLCLQHHKAVLCEKAFALNTRHAKEMIDFARKQKTFLMEAFWTKFLPQYQKAVEIINAGTIGDIKWIQADFGFNAGNPVPPRLIDPSLGGGALLDIGIYPVFLAQSILGKPSEIHASATLYPTGVDEQCSITMKFPNGALAALSSTLAADTPVEAVIAGTKGSILLKSRFHNAIAIIELAVGKDEPHPVDVHREEGFGYQFEARHVGECLRKGLIESPVMSHHDTIMQMETLDQIKKLCGIKYAVD